MLNESQQEVLNLMGNTGVKKSDFELSPLEKLEQDYEDQSLELESTRKSLEKLQKEFDGVSK